MRYVEDKTTASKDDEYEIKLADILKQLLDTERMTVSQLARAVNVPQPTLNTLLLGQTKNPKIETLLPIAKYFNISLDQLLGFAALEGQERLSCTVIPIIEWSDIEDWINKDRDKILEQALMIATEKTVGQDAFCVKSTRAMEPVFRCSTILIVDTTANLHDGSYVIFEKQKSSYTIKRVLKDGAQIYLEPLHSNSEPTLKYEPKTQRICGVIIESRNILN